jgi:hypothetical protein
MLSKTQMNQPNSNNLNGSTGDLGKILFDYIQSDRFKVYKLNVLRFMTVLMAYVEIICVAIILAAGGIYNPKGVN